MGRAVTRKEWRNVSRHAKRLIRMKDLKEEDLREVYEVLMHAAEREKAGLAEEMMMRRMEEKT